MTRIIGLRGRHKASPVALTATAWAVSSVPGPAGPGQDRFGANGRLFVVADGMGGMRLGDLAATAAVTELFRRAPRDASGLEEALFLANSAVRALGLEGDGRVGTTLSALLLAPEGPCLVSVGDSRIHIARDDEPLTPLTVDDTIAAEKGLAPEDLVFDEANRILTAWLGLHPVLGRAAKALPILTVRARVLLTTDGVHDVVSVEEMSDIAVRCEDAWECATTITARATRNGTRDDATTVVVDLEAGHE